MKLFRSLSDKLIHPHSGNPIPSPIPKVSPQEITPQQVKDLLAAENPPFLLDVRESAELAASGWIPGMVHIPMNSVSERMDELPADRPILIYCAHGIRSYDVARYLMDNNHREASSMAGGLAAWTGEVVRK